MRSLLSRALRDLPGIVLMAVGTFAEANALLAQASPQLMIVDLELSDGSGLDLIANLLDKNGPTGVLAMGAPMANWPEALPHNGDVRYLEKPINAHQLRRLTRSWTHAALPPPPFGVVEYLQLACLGRRSVIVRCESRRSRGSVVVYGGELWDAKVRTPHGKLISEGVDAFRHCVATESQRVIVSTVTEPPERTLQAHWEYLLMDTHKLMDEGVPLSQESPRTDESELPPALSRTRPTEQRPSHDGTKNLVAEAVRAIIAGRYVEAETKLESAHALAPKDAMIAHRLRKLREIRRA